ncbi:hypothetical protein ACT3CD_06280 [Geofilum sp. OHC36d9]|uniref:hypothetical protein n=1 Tax=Geofilum sp. OHC36d9 TaxID=3458413 RepID=UPI0040332EAA
MKISFLDNGIDSLKKGFDYLMKYEEDYFSDSPSKNRFFYLKDSIILTQHGVEILIKHILAKNNELLLFSNLDKHVKQSYIEKRVKGLESVFNSSLKDKIHTVSFTEAIERFESFCNCTLKKSLKDKLLLLESYRNVIIHSEIYFNENEINNLFENLFDELDALFINEIGDSYTTLSGYSELLHSYELVKVYLDKKNLEQKRNVIDSFISVFKKLSISMGLNEVKLITDIDKASKILDEFINQGHIFGTDLYNGYCSGDVRKIIRHDKERLAIYTEDNGAIYIFKFKSLLLYLPNYDSEFSPLLFLGADNDVAEENCVVKKDCNEIESYEYLYFPEENRYEKSEEQINLFYSRMDNDDHFVRPYYYSVTHFLTKGNFCFLNFQYLEYQAFAKDIVYKWKNEDSKRIMVELRKMLNNK